MFGRVQDFVTKWRAGLSKHQSAHFHFNIKICVILFVKGLPSVPAFNTLHADLPQCISAIDNDQDFGAFISLTETVLELDTIFWPTTQSQVIHAPRVAPASSTTSPPVPGILPTTLNFCTPKKNQICNNCKSRGLRTVRHTDATCFQPGGGMEGQCEEYLSNKSRIHVMFAESLEHSFLLSDPHLPPDPSLSSSSPTLSPALDNKILIPPIANLSVASFVPNKDLHEYLYAQSDFKLLPRFALASVDFNSAAIVSLVSLYNALLDSGCTHHIIRDREPFCHYIPQTISIGTANCGSLETLGTGDIEFNYSFQDHQFTFTLRSCLHAPSAPINLLLVGALAERGMSCLFSPGGITKISFPEDHPRLPGLSFSATVVNCLSFLNLSFLSPMLPLISTTMPALVPPQSAYSFPCVKQDSALWHQHFGHIGMNATR